MYIPYSNQKSKKNRNHGQIIKNNRFLYSQIICSNNVTYSDIIKSEAVPLVNRSKTSITATNLTSLLLQYLPIHQCYFSTIKEHNKNDVIR